MRRIKQTATPATGQAVYTVEEARAILKIGRSTMIRLCLSGAIRSITIGRCRRIPAAAIDQFVTGGSQDGSAA